MHSARIAPVFGRFKVLDTPRVMRKMFAYLFIGNSARDAGMSGFGALNMVCLVVFECARQSNLLSTQSTGLILVTAHGKIEKCPRDLYASCSWKIGTNTPMRALVRAFFFE